MPHFTKPWESFMRHSNFLISEMSKGFNYQKISRVKGTINICSFRTLRSLLPFTPSTLYFVTYRRLTPRYPWPKERGISGRIYGIYIIIAVPGGNLSLLYSYKSDVAVRALPLTSAEGLAAWAQGQLWQCSCGALKESCEKTQQIPAPPLLKRCLWA